MKRIILFSTPTDNNLKKLLDALLPESDKSRVVGYIPAEGAAAGADYVPQWQNWIAGAGGHLIVIDNAAAGEAAAAERAKIEQCSAILLSGGNTFTLLRNLRRSGLNEAIKKFAQRPDFVLAGFSAGAIILTPSIADAADYDDNTVGLTDLTGLKLVDFEIWPHYTPDYENELDFYRQSSANEVRPITDDEIVVIDA